MTRSVLSIEALCGSRNVNQLVAQRMRALLRDDDSSFAAPTNLYALLPFLTKYVQSLTQNGTRGVDSVLRRYSVYGTAIFAVFLLGISVSQGQEPKHRDLTGKWQLRTESDKGKEDISTLDLTESGSALVGTVTPLNGRAMRISDGYYVGAAIKISASGRQGLFSKSIEISGRVEVRGNKMLLNVKKGNGTTYSAIAERMPMNERK
jgi:hypothetical protein